MGVYINMEMPKGFTDVRIYADGRVISQSFSKFGGQIATAVPVPPHGRCVDADKLMQDDDVTCGCFWADQEIAVGRGSTPTEALFDLAIKLEHEKLKDT